MTEQVEKKSEYALITGASSGLGEIFARELAAHGWPLILVARRAARLRALAEALENAYGVHVHTVPADLTVDGGVDLVMDEVAKIGAHVGTLVNNAGAALHGRFAEMSLPDQMQMMRLNMEPTVELTYRLLPAMRAVGHGGILNVASMAAFQAGPMMTVYYATKAFVLSFSEGLHEEVRKDGIHVTCLCPGPTETELVDLAGIRESRLVKYMGRRPEPVVWAGLRALERNKAVVIPGALNHFIITSLRFAPPGLPRNVAKFLHA
ncbi:MAG TPA: SDR family oxidoreductase [Caulobacteraceae bacterium]|jgi:hypothetical protein